MWKAKVINKELINGLLRVNVEFANDKEKFQDTFETNQKQSPNWLREQVAARLRHLNALPDLHDAIQKGSEITHDAVPDISDLSGHKAEFKKNLDQFHRWVNAISASLTTRENESFVELLEWLRANFRDDYIDLF